MINPSLQEQTGCISWLAAVLLDLLWFSSYSDSSICSELSIMLDNGRENYRG
jgi:hypothetical protein